jgi:hypothetical protein
MLVKCNFLKPEFLKLVSIVPALWVGAQPVAAADDTTEVRKMLSELVPERSPIASAAPIPGF